MRVPLLRVLAAAVLAGVPAAALAKDTKPPKLVHEAETTAARDQDLEIRADIRDRSGVFEPNLYYRQVGQERYTKVPLELDPERPHSYRAVIPGADMSQDIEYFLEAFDELGNGPARVGQMNSPLIVKLAAEAPPGDPPPDDPTAVGPEAPTETPEATQQDGALPPWTLWAAVGGSAAALAIIGAGSAVLVWYLFLQPPEPEPQGAPYVTLEVSGPPPVEAFRVQP